jgi:methionine-rich copper-binding protein CopC
LEAWACLANNGVCRFGQRLGGTNELRCCRVAAIVCFRKASCAFQWDVANDDLAAFHVVALMCGAFVREPADVWAQTVQLLDSIPAPNTTISGRSIAFSVRFDRPVDHARSVLAVKRDGEVVETLQPRLQSAPQVLFARASILPPGKYQLYWQVRTVTDVETRDGEIPFTVSE